MKTIPCGLTETNTSNGCDYGCSYGGVDCSRCVLNGGAFDPRTNRKASKALRAAHVAELAAEMLETEFIKKEKS